MILLFLFTGQCKAKFTSKKVPYCIKFNPDEDKQHLFVAGTSDKKIICVSHQNVFLCSMYFIVANFYPLENLCTKPTHFIGFLYC